MTLAPETFDLGLYDSDTGATITTEKVVEQLTPSGDRIVLAYGRAKRGLLVQITFPYNRTPGAETIGMSVHFFMDDLTPPARREDKTLATMARIAGMKQADFVALLRREAPGQDPRP